MHILDTGPVFKFLTTDCVPQLLAALGHNVVNVPAAVDFEITDTPTRRKQFKRAAEIWPRFPERFKNVLPDEPTDALRECCRSVLGMDFEDMYARKMQHLRGQHVPGGQIQHADTLTLLRWAIEADAFDSQADFVKKYNAMAYLDEALPKDVKTTGLTKRPPWPLTT